MESIISSQVISEVSKLLDISKKDPKAEFECKILSGKIQTKDTVDRLLKTLTQ